MPLSPALDDYPPITAIQGRLVGFVRLLRASGFRVGLAEAIDTQRILTLSPPFDGRYIRLQLRTLLCSDKSEWDQFDDLFEKYWLVANRLVETFTSKNTPPQEKQQEQATSSPQSSRQGQKIIFVADQLMIGTDAASNDPASQKGRSLSGHDQRVDLGFMQDVDEMRKAIRLAESIAQKMSTRLVRRQRPTSRDRSLDMRKTIRHSLATGGLPIHLSYKDKHRHPWKLIFLIDASRSMSMYSGVFMRFARAMALSLKNTSVFAYHTRLVPVSEALYQKNLKKMAAKLEPLSVGWGGGTKIGVNIERLTQEYSHLLNKSSIVVVYSDGLDTGSPQVLSDALEKLKKRCHKLIWLNPLLGRDGYSPTAQGMQAALPYIDTFAPAHNLESLAKLEKDFMVFSS